MKNFILTVSFLLFGCSSSKCPSESEESVSTCRAKKECGGVGTAIGMLLGGFGSGMNGGRNQAQDNYDQCMSRNLASQKANAGIKDNTQHCVSRQVASDQVETTCN